MWWRTASRFRSSSVLIAAYLVSISDASGDAAAGAAKYTSFCGKCHDGALRVGARVDPEAVDQGDADLIAR